MVKTPYLYYINIKTMKNLEVVRTYYPITPTFKGYDGTLRLKVTNIYSVFEIDGGYKVCLTANLTKRNPKPISKSLDVDRAIEFANYLYTLFHK